MHPQGAPVFADLVERLDHHRILGEPLVDRWQFPGRYSCRQHRRLVVVLCYRDKGHGK